MAYLAPSLVRLFDEVNERWPARDTWSDGWFASPAHVSAAPVSDHNPDQNGMVHAADIDATLTQMTMGPGTVGDFLAAAILTRCRDGRLRNVVRYLIYKGRIYSASTNYAARTYTGTNAHNSHVHISIYYTTTAEQYAGPWGIRGDWVDMADRDDIKAALKEAVAELEPTLRRIAQEAAQAELGNEGALVAKQVWGYRLPDPTSIAAPQTTYAAGTFLRDQIAKRIIAALKP